MQEKSKGGHGGARKGAGRRVTEARKALLAASEKARAEAMATCSGELPLDYMLRVMRDATADTKRRDGMAIAAANFIHARLANVEHSGDKDNPIHTKTVIEQRIVDADADTRTDHTDQRPSEARPPH